MNPQSDFWSVSVYAYINMIYTHIICSRQIGSEYMLILIDANYIKDLTTSPSWSHMAFAQTFAAAAAIWSEVASCEPLSWNSVGWDVFSSKKKTGWWMKEASATLTRWLYGIWGLSGQSIKSLAQTELNTTEAHVAPQGPWAAGCLFLDQLKGWHSNTARRECIWFHGREEQCCKAM